VTAASFCTTGHYYRQISQQEAKLSLEAVHILYNGLREGGGFRNLLYALYEGERDVCADVI